MKGKGGKRNDIITYFIIYYDAISSILIGAVSIGGTVFIVLFGDVIVCVLVLMWLIKRLINRKK